MDRKIMGLAVAGMLAAMGGEAFAIRARQPEASPVLSLRGISRTRGHGEGLPGNKYSKNTVAQDKRRAIKAKNKARHRRHS